MNTKSFPATFSIFFFLLPVLIACTSEDRFLICRNSEYDCDFQHHIPGIVTITKGSSRKHYILTDKGLEESGIKESEPIAFNHENGIALVKELTDSSIEIFTADARSGKKLSSGILLKPERIAEKEGEPLLAVPTLLSSCVRNDGSIILLLNYEKLELTDFETSSESSDFLYIYEKGKTKNPKKYVFPKNDPKDNESEKGDYFFETPREIQCTDENIYVFSEKTYGNREPYFDKYYPQPNWILCGTNPDPHKEEAPLGDIALIAYDDIRFNRYFKKENAVYTVTRSSEEETPHLHILSLNKGYELPEEPIEKGEGEFLFSERPDGRPLLFFVGTRNGVEEQRLELIF